MGRLPAPRNLPSAWPGMIRRLPLGLAAMACGLAGLLAVELGSQAAERHAAVPADHFAVTRQEAPEAGAPPAALVPAILARPLFNPSRRPPAAKVPVAREAAFRLSGVIIYGKRRLAIFAQPGGKTTIAASGARFGDWTVSSVEPGGVKLAGPGGVRRLRPRFVTAPAAALAPAPEPDPVSAAMAASRRALVKLLGKGGSGGAEALARPSATAASVP